MVAVPLAQPETRSVAQIATQAASRRLLTLALHLARLVPAASPSSWERSRARWTMLGRRPLPVQVSVSGASLRSGGSGRLSQLDEQHDGDQCPDHARRGRCSRSGDELRDGGAGGDDHRRSEADDDRRGDVGRRVPVDDDADRHDRDDEHKGDEPVSYTHLTLPTIYSV